MSKLTTHVLDAFHGRPAAGVLVTLARTSWSPQRVAGEAQRIVEARTNADGRCPQPLMDESAFAPGTYELAFHVAEYYRAQGVQLPDPPFLDVVVVHVGLAAGAGNYHVPLLVTPWSYSTYRGS